MKEIPRDRVKGVLVPSQDISRVINELFVKGKEEKTGGNAGLCLRLHGRRIEDTA